MVKFSQVSEAQSYAQAGIWDLTASHPASPLRKHQLRKLSGSRTQEIRGLGDRQAMELRGVGA